MSTLDLIDLERLRGDLQLRPLSAQAIRAAHALVRNGREFFDAGCYELERCDLAEFVYAEESPLETEDDDPDDVWIASTPLLKALAASGMLDVLETPRLCA